ncbi:hypothetical protein GCM10009555_060380 [Acrocarpospora macrocephala]|nr:hypothetical protein [Acrocarpospora macrocephala]
MKRTKLFGLFMGAALGITAMSVPAIPAHADTTITYRQLWENGGRGTLAGSGVTAVYAVDDSRTMSAEEFARRVMRGEFGDYDGEGAFEVTHTLDAFLSSIYTVYIGPDFKVGVEVNGNGTYTVTTCVNNNGSWSCTSETRPA